MESFKKVAVAALLSAISIEKADAAGAAKPYGYLFNGVDWAYEKDWQCADTNQSPIYLRTDLHSNPFQKSDGSEITTNYENFKGATVLNKGLVVQVNMPDADAKGRSPKQWFESKYAEENLGSSAKYRAAQFHFHAKSEHTINGKRYDMEMHTVHLAESYNPARRRLADAAAGAAHFASAMGLMFDVDDYDPTITAEEKMVIDRFFDSMNFAKAAPTATSENMANWKAGQDVDGDFIKLASNADVPYGDLMKIVNFANRWVYAGSLTTPPCTTGVYFQVVDRVLPISKAHYDAYVAHQATWMQTAFTGSDGAGKTAPATIGGVTIAKQLLSVTGNWRATNVVDKHNVRYMRADYSTEGPQATTTIILGVLLGVSIIVAIILAVCACKQMTAPEKGVGAEQNEGGQEEEVEL